MLHSVCQIVQLSVVWRWAGSIQLVYQRDIAENSHLLLLKTMLVVQAMRMNQNSEVVGQKTNTVRRKKP